MMQSASPLNTAGATMGVDIAAKLLLNYHQASMSETAVRQGTAPSLMLSH
jgi:hypothetical protein